MSIPPPFNQTAQLRYINRVDVTETYADSLRGMTFDGASLRLELCVNRIDPVTLVPPATPVADQVTACRLVLSPQAAMELINQLKQLEGALLASGQLRQIHVPPPGKAN
jgi:hypothetical protein